MALIYVMMASRSGVFYKSCCLSRAILSVESESRQESPEAGRIEEPMFHWRGGAACRFCSFLCAGTIPRGEIQGAGRATCSRLQPCRGRDERQVTMNSRNSHTKQLLSARWEEYRSRGATGVRMSRRALLRASAGSAVVSAVGIGGLLELLTNREAIAAGKVIAIVGVTREPFMAPDETPHRHTFSVHFQVTHVSATAIMGNVVGHTEAVISTSPVEEEQHFHLISMQNVSLEAVILSGPENNESGEHTHQLSIE